LIRAPGRRLLYAPAIPAKSPRIGARGVMGVAVQ